VCWFCCPLAGVGVFNVGEGAAQDRVWPSLSAADVEGAQAGVWAVREGTSGRGTTREAQQTQGEEGTVQTTSGRSTSNQQVWLSIPTYSILVTNGLKFLIYLLHADLLPLLHVANLRFFTVTLMTLPVYKPHIKLIIVSVAICCSDWWMKYRPVLSWWRFS